MRRSRSSSKNYVFAAGCGSDNGRSLVATAAIGLVDRLVVELFVVAKYVVSIMKRKAVHRQPFEHMLEHVDG